MHLARLLHPVNQLTTPISTQGSGLPFLEGLYERVHNHYPTYVVSHPPTSTPSCLNQSIRSLRMPQSHAYWLALKAL